MVFAVAVEVGKVRPSRDLVYCFWFKVMGFLLFVDVAVVYVIF